MPVGYGPNGEVPSLEQMYAPGSVIEVPNEGGYYSSLYKRIKEARVNNQSPNSAGPGIGAVVNDVWTKGATYQSPNSAGVRPGNVVAGQGPNERGGVYSEFASNATPSSKAAEEGQIIDGVWVSNKQLENMLLARLAKKTPVEMITREIKPSKVTITDLYSQMKTKPLSNQNYWDNKEAEYEDWRRAGGLTEPKTDYDLVQRYGSL